ncbi:DUF4321 domain-containing protein [Desulfoscipio geothermicus]|uniref:DUF4321 domain-containing protein n=1 Tax=Desulfoscipio geothermicus DSM 3669 TaxID=1121426 RepID=A0A1I6DS12_9FIRM|nr:DUF4321 domain-containing protein [Desulfoscipio geothermicus]SFR08161.1 protein of unknown function [Desulfoscipio geothermicus DSM 3669]
MSRVHRGGKSPWVLLLLLLAGGLAGSALSGTLAQSFPFLAATGKIGLQPATLNLHFMQLTFGATVDMGPVTALGLVLGYLIYRKI